MTKYLLILLLLLQYSFPGYSQAINHNDELRKIIRAYGQAEVSVPVVDMNETERISRNVSVMSLKDKTLYIVLSELTVEWFIKQNYNYNIIERAEAKGIVMAESPEQAMEWESYPTYTQYLAVMESFASTYPGLCDVDTIGTSIMGRLILVLKISDNVDVEEDEPEVFYTSTMHGDETGGFILMLRLAGYLLDNYSKDSRVAGLVDDLEIWINPLANPDGTYRLGNIISSPVRWNANNTDLNRNFPDPDPSAPATVLQKENIDMIRFMRERKFILSANFHAGAEVVNYPWDRWDRLHADNDWFHYISRKYADTVHSYSIPIYMKGFDNGITRGIEWYQIYGGRQDFVTYELQGREVTIELDDDKLTPADELQTLWQNNWHSLIGYLENALHGIHGNISDANSSEPIAARIFIKGHDKDSSHVYSDTITGNFVRMLSAGTWDLYITAGGYTDVIISSIEVDKEQNVNLFIRMTPLSEPAVPTGNKPVLYPNPAVSVLRMMMPEAISGNVNIKVYSQSGMRIKDYNAEVTTGTSVELDVTRFASGVYNILVTNILTHTSCSGRFVVIRK